MIALELTEVKECMGKLLLSELFDPFYFIEGEIVTFGTFTLDGYLKKDFFEKDETPERVSNLFWDYLIRILKNYSYSKSLILNHRMCVDYISI